MDEKTTKKKLENVSSTAAELEQQIFKWNDATKHFLECY